MKYITSLVLGCVFLPILFLILFTPEPCEHEDMVMKYSFSDYDSTSLSYVKTFCEKCNNYFGYTLFRGTPDDISYLEVIRASSDGNEIIGGDYYTVTATVQTRFVGYASESTWLNCKVESEDTIVGFSVEFQDEFRKQVSSIEEGDEITFRGRFYDEGCGFTDCELIEHRVN